MNSESLIGISLLVQTAILTSLGTTELAAPFMTANGLMIGAIGIFYNEDVEVKTGKGGEK